MLTYVPRSRLMECWSVLRKDNYRLIFFVPFSLHRLDDFEIICKVYFKVTWGYHSYFLNFNVGEWKTLPVINLSVTLNNLINSNPINFNLCSSEVNRLPRLFLDSLNMLIHLFSVRQATWLLFNSLVCFWQTRCKHFCCLNYNQLWAIFD